jgi:hypothetical protein
VGVPINQTTATIVSTVTATATGNGMSSSTENHTAVAAVSSVLSTLLAVSLCAIAFLIWKLRRLQSGSGGASVAPPSGTTEQVNGGKGPVEAMGPEPYELPEHRG